MAIIDTVRKYVEAGRDALSPQKAEDIARGLAKQGEIRRDQVAGMARDLVEWSRRNRERLMDLIRREVKKQIARTGVATKDELDALKRRIRELERGARTAASTAATTARKRASTAARKTGAGTRKAGAAARKASSAGKKSTAARRTPT